MSKPKIYGARWKIVSSAAVLGSGGQGTVMKVTDLSGEHPGEWALKLVRGNRRTRRFENEVKALTKLAHPNIIKLIDHSALDVGFSGSANYLVMPIAKGGDLSEPERLRLCMQSIENCLPIANQLTAALAAAHAANVIHRDVKPRNILFVGPGSELWLSDFGICLIGEADRSTELGEIVGPRYFMAPELEEWGPLDATPAADIYSLGKVIYYMYSGGVVIPREYLREPRYQRIFENGGRSQLLRQLLERMICSVEERISDIATVERELKKIEEWEERAALLSLQPAMLERMHELKQRVRKNRAIKYKNNEAREQEEDRIFRTSRLLRQWMLEELKKIAEVARSEELEVDVQEFSGLDMEEFDLRADLNMQCDCDDWLRLSIRNIDSQHEHHINFFVCEEDSDPFPWNPLARGVRAGDFIAPRDLRIAIVPAYAFAKKRETLSSTVAMMHYLIEKDATGQFGLGNLAVSPFSLQPSDATADFRRERNKHLVFGASEWPSNSQEIGRLISDAVGMLFENVEAEMTMS